MCDVNVGCFAILQTVKKESISTNPEQYRPCRSLHPDRDTSCPRLPLLLFHPTNKLLTASDDFFVQMQIWMLLVLLVTRGLATVGIDNPRRQRRPFAEECPYGSMRHVSSIGYL